MLRKLTTITLLFLLSIMYLSAQNVLFFNSKQGLSNSCTNSIYEDSRHNIWIATLNGLNRYDGVKLNVYYHKDNDDTSLRHDEVINVFEYDRDHIIVCTGSGLQIYDYETDKFITIPFIGIQGDTLNVRFSTANRVHIDGKEHVLACFSGYGYAELTRDADGTFHLQHTADLNPAQDDSNPQQFFEDRQKHLFIIPSGGNVYRRVGKKFKKYTEVSKAIKLALSATGKVYVATSTNGIYKYNQSADKFVQVVTPEQLGGEVYGFNPWRDTRMFVCTDGSGLLIYDEKTNSVTENKIQINNIDITHANVKDAICDTYGNVWAGIYWMGVMMKPHNQSAFDYVGHNSITKNTIGNNSIFMLAPADASHIWVAPDNDYLYLLSNDGKTSRHFAQEANMPKAVTAIDAVGGENLLIGTYTQGLWDFNGNTCSLITKEINQIFDIQPADNDCFWITTMGNGVFYFNPYTKQSVHYTTDWSNGDKGALLIQNPYIYCALQHGNLLFLGTADGINICNYKGNGILQGKSTKILNHSAIRHIVLSNDRKHLWVATNNGLYAVDIKTHSVKRYGTNEGLANNSVKAVSVDGSNIWISTDNGLSCLNTKTDKFTNFFADDGLQDNEFNRGAILYNAGNLYIGGISGLTYFNPKSILSTKKTTKELKIKLVDLRLNAKYIHVGDKSGSYDILKDVLDDCARIDLAHNDNRFYLDVCVEGLSNQHVYYEYSVNGGEWISQDAVSGRIVFENYSPGTYNIRLRAHVFNAVSEERELTVVIHPAWYASWWAKLIYLLLFALLCYLAYQYAQRQIAARRILERHRHEREINEARIQFFMNISHEIRTPMTLILAPIDKLIRMDKDAECQRNYQLIKQNANRILRLINQMMDVRKIEQGKYQLDYHKVELISLIQNTFDVFKTQAENRHITYHFVHDVDEITATVDPENLDKIVMNLLSNAFKFTPDNGKITLSLDTAESSSFKLSVTDTGCGIKDEDKTKVFDRFYSDSHKKGYIGTGIGLNLTSLLVHLHQGDIKVEDNPVGQGSAFIVSMPYSAPESSHIVSQVKQEETVSDASATTTEGADSAADTQVSTETDISLVDIEKGTTIILVEDDSSIREYVHSELSEDLNVIDFSDGQQAWDYVIAHPKDISLVVSDIMMPVMDGLTLCQKVKSNFNTNHIPILLMTALGSDADRIVGITNGADAYVTKPFNIDVLRTTVLGLLKNRQLLQGRFKSEKLQEDSIEKKEIESPDEALMRRIMKAINDNLDNDELSVEMIADIVGISRVHFYRKMKDMTGQSPREFVKYVRLKEAARMLETKKMDIAGVSIACGFKSPSSFSTYFKALYGVSPSEYMKQKGEEK